MLIEEQHSVQQSDAQAAARNGLCALSMQASEQANWQGI